MTISPNAPEYDRELARAIMHAMDRHPTDAGHLALVLLLATYPEGLCTTDIQAHLGTPIATTVDLIVREREAGAVETFDHPVNARFTMVRLTPKAWQERRRARWNRGK